MMDTLYQQDRYKDIIYHLVPRVEQETKRTLSSYLDKYGLEVMLNTYLSQPCRRVDSSTIVMNNIDILISFERDKDGFRTYKFSKATYSSGNNITFTNHICDIEVVPVNINIIIKIARIFKPDFNITKNEDCKTMLTIERFIDSETDNSFRTLRLCHDVYSFGYSMLQTLRELDKMKGETSEDVKPKRERYVKHTPY